MILSLSAFGGPEIISVKQTSNVFSLRNGQNRLLHHIAIWKSINSDGCPFFTRITLRYQSSASSQFSHCSLIMAVSWMRDLLTFRINASSIHVYPSCHRHHWCNFQLSATAYARVQFVLTSCYRTANPHTCVASCWKRHRHVTRAKITAKCVEECANGTQSTPLPRF